MPSEQTMQNKENDKLKMLLKDIRELFSNPNNVVNIAQVEKTLLSYNLSRQDWQKFSVFCPGRYTRNLVDEHEKYNVMILNWSNGVSSTVHDHSGAHCFMKLLEGNLRETRYEWPKDDDESEMNVLCQNNLHENGTKVIYINDEVGLHKVENVSRNQNCSTLHIYSPPYGSCKCFDETSGKCQEVNVIFDSAGGKLTGNKIPESSFH